MPSHNSKASLGQVNYQTNGYLVFQLAGKSVVVTGAAGSIGTQVAIMFSKTGVNLLLSDVSTKALERLRQNVELQGPYSGRIEYRGTWHGCDHAVLSMRKHGKSSGSAINTSSMVGLIGSATAQLAYTTTKEAIIAMTQEFAIIHSREGFRFNALCPGPLKVPLMQDYLGMNVERRARREIRLPQSRFGEPIEQATAALFLASDASSFVDAQELIVDGGLTKAYVTPEGLAYQGI
ncbi:NAD(P)-binding protein [Colletotrichum somersetense]|nr:NAD(P)-binding protein [Colletotrichum somersetense]